MASVPAEAEVTVQSFAQWLSELKTRSNSSLQQLLSEMSSLRDGITGASGELTEFKRHSTAVQQQIGSQLTDLRDTLNSAFTEITNLVKQKTVTDKELQSEINSISNQVGMKTAELEALRKSYSATHQQLKNHLITLQQSIQDTYSEVQVVKAQADRVAQATDEKYAELEHTLTRVTALYDEQKNEGDAMAETVHHDLVAISTDIANMSQDFFEGKRYTKNVQQKLEGQVQQLTEAQREHDTRATGLKGHIEGLEESVSRTYQDLSMLLAQRMPGGSARVSAKASPVPGVSAAVARPTTVTYPGVGAGMVGQPPMQPGMPAPAQFPGMQPGMQPRMTAPAMPGQFGAPMMRPPY